MILYREALFDSQNVMTYICHDLFVCFLLQISIDAYVVDEMARLIFPLHG